MRFRVPILSSGMQASGSGGTFPATLRSGLKAVCLTCLIPDSFWPMRFVLCIRHLPRHFGTALARYAVTGTFLV